MFKGKRIHAHTDMHQHKQFVTHPLVYPSIPPGTVHIKQG